MTQANNPVTDPFLKYAATPEEDEAIRLSERDVAREEIIAKVAYADLAVYLNGSTDGLKAAVSKFVDSVKELERIKKLFESRKDVLRDIMRIANPNTIDIKFRGDGIKEITPTNVLPQELSVSDGYAIFQPASDGEKK